MRLQDIEDAAWPAEPYLVDMFHNIYQNCQPFLQEVDDPTKVVLYRGIQALEDSDDDHHETAVGIKTVRLNNRLPTDTAHTDHVEINQYFEQAYGHPYRNGLFAVGLASIAENYGRVYAIFPIGKFDYIWHSKITDLYSDIIQDESGSDHWRNFAASKVGKEKMDSWDTEEWNDFVELYSSTDLLSWFIDEEVGPYNTNNLKQGIQFKRTEIMIWVKQYYYIHPTFLPQFKAFISK